MANRAAQERVVAVRRTADGTGFLLRFRVRLEAGDVGDLAAGWYVVNVPVANLRAFEPASDEPMTVEEQLADETIPVAERLDLLGGQ